jgi:hypothetical protein
LLQQGLWVADICHLAIERAPNRLDIPIGPGNLGERPGYNYDSAPAEAVLSRFSVRDGKMVLPDGMSYRVLTLPEVETMTPALLRKIGQLVFDGATVIGPKPLKSPGLSGYPDCDRQIKSLADKLWGDDDGDKVKEHAYGKGRIIWGETAEEVLRGMKVPPDFTYEDSRGGPTLLYAHHVLGDVDFYFVANRQNQAVAGTAHFRVEGRRPEFWWPQTGRTELVAVYTQAGGITSIPMQLDACESVFVVFRASTGRTDPVASVTLNNQPIIPPTVETPSHPLERVARVDSDDRGNLRLEAWKAGAYEVKMASGAMHPVSVPPIPAPVDITGPWQIHFPFQNKDLSIDQLSSWSDLGQTQVKYFSGTASYHKIFQVPAAMLTAGRHLYLDLGDVEVNAEVTLNGKNLGLLWKSPYRLEITPAAVAGENSLEVKVTNLWVNRQIGDQQLPPDSDRDPDGSLKSWPQWLLDGKPDPHGQQTFTSWTLWKKTDPLLPSGLLGPVRLQSSMEVSVH